MINTVKIRRDFPIFAKKPELVYLDSTATSLKPASVIEKEAEYYSNYCANVYRGIYKISERATEEFEKSRKAVSNFINSKRAEEIIFTRSTTESINLLSSCLESFIGKNDEIVTTIMEHHSNFVPWQVLAHKRKAKLKVLGIDINGMLDVFCDRKSCGNKIYLEEIITKKTKIFAITYVSNVLGTINPLKKIISAAKKINKNVIIVVDAAQAAPRTMIDVSDLGCDFLAFSSHKMCGPTGVGVLWGRYEFLEDLPPYNLGGEMIEKVTINHTDYKKPPHKFEAGTPNIAGVIGLGEAVLYLKKFSKKDIENHENSLVVQAKKRMLEEFGNNFIFYGPKETSNCSGILSFTLKNIHPHDIARILDEENICVRAGTHCAMPLHQTLGVFATTRASFYIYNDFEDIEKFVKGLKKVWKILKK